MRATIETCREYFAFLNTGTPHFNVSLYYATQMLRVFLIEGKALYQQKDD